MVYTEEQFYDACKQGNEEIVLEYLQLKGNTIDYGTVIIYLSMGKNV